MNAKCTVDFVHRRSQFVESRKDFTLSSIISDDQSVQILEGELYFNYAFNTRVKIKQGLLVSKVMFI